MEQSQKSHSIALIAGGRSSRMGTDKGLLSFMGKPLFMYIIDQVTALSDDVFVISNHPERYTSSEYPIYQDKIPGIGALGGLHSALVHAQHDLCFALACDMPFVNKGILTHLHKNADQFDVVIPQLDTEKLEPFRALYRKTCLPVIEEAIHSGERRAIGFLSRVRTQKIPRSELIRFNPALDTFLNINTPLDLEVIEAYAIQLAQDVDQ